MSLELLPPPPLGIRAVKAVAKDEGVSTSTIERRVDEGMLVKVNVSGRGYITLESLENFYKRAIKGEFSKDAHGAAQKKNLTKRERVA
jgi:hypothetical protein